MNQWVTQNERFRWNEFFVSKKHPALAREMKLTPQWMDKIDYFVEAALDPWRTLYPDYPLVITSGVRSHELNVALGGADRSDHVYGIAIDCGSPRLTGYDLFCSIINKGLPYRQLIWYKKKGHVHWSMNLPGKPWKHEVMISQ